MLNQVSNPCIVSSMRYLIVSIGYCSLCVESGRPVSYMMMLMRQWFAYFIVAISLQLLGRKEVMLLPGERLLEND